MKRLFIGIVIFFISCIHVFAENLSIDEKIILDKQVGNIIRSFDKSLLKQNIENREKLVNKLVEKISKVLTKRMSDKNKYLLQEIFYIYSARSDFFKETKYYSVDRILDGDTIEVSNENEKIQIRLIGVDTPERKDCYFSDASKNLSDKILGKKVILSTDLSQSDEDIFDRKLRYVFLENGEFINAWILSQGLGSEYTYKTPYKFQEFFKNLQEVSSYQKKGKWSDTLDCNLNQDVLLNPEEEIKNNDVKNIKEVNYGFYTSSHHTSHLYYCATDSAWEGLSKSYLQFYETETELLKKYPQKTLSSPCY